MSKSFCADSILGSLKGSEGNGFFNGVVDSNSNINITEGKQIVITLDVYDDDFLIPAAQRSYYNESLSFNLTIQGRNNQLFNFTLLTAPTTGSNRSVYESVFTTNTSDPGVYNITINISDNSSGSAVLRFNLTIANISHGPTLTSIDDKNFSIFETFMHDFNLPCATQASRILKEMQTQITTKFRNNILFAIII